MQYDQTITSLLTFSDKSAFPPVKSDSFFFFFFFYLIHLPASLISLLKRTAPYINIHLHIVFPHRGQRLHENHSATTPSIFVIIIHAKTRHRTKRNGFIILPDKHQTLHTPFSYFMSMSRSIIYSSIS